MRTLWHLDERMDRRELWSIQRKGLTDEQRVIVNFHPQEGFTMRLGSVEEAPT